MTTDTPRPQRLTVPRSKLLSDLRTKSRNDIDAWSCTIEYIETLEDHIAALAADLERARAVALEECAKICEYRGYDSTADDIRALAQQKPGETP